MNQQLLKEIQKCKSLMNINEGMVSLSNIEDYTNVRVDDDTKNDEIPISLLSDINAAAENAGVVVTITTAKSGHRMHTSTNNISRHTKGLAVDIAIIDGIGSDKATNANNGNAQFREKGNSFVAYLEKLGYKRNKESGNEKAVLWQTDIGGNHYNHIHISNTDVESESGASGAVGGESEEEKLLQKILNYEIDGKKVSEIVNDPIKSFEDFLKLLAAIA